MTGADGEGGGELLAALRDLAAGRGVRRGRHRLDDAGGDAAALFQRALRAEGFAPQRVRDADVQSGERAPAFVVRGAVADFGWVFWERFRPGRERKLFGSAVRDARGDWEIQIGPGSPELVYVHTSRRERVDPDHPPALG